MYLIVHQFIFLSLFYVSRLRFCHSGIIKELLTYLLKNLKLKMQVWSHKWISITPAEKSTYAGMATSKEEHTYTGLQNLNRVTRHIRVINAQVKY